MKTEQQKQIIDTLQTAFDTDRDTASLLFIRLYAPNELNRKQEEYVLSFLATV